jgi:hypothetical protein
LIIPLTQAFCQVKTRSEQSKTPIDRGSSAGPSEGNSDLKNFAKKGLEKFYSKPYKNGRIIFRKCNIDKDSLTARKYKIFGSALGFKKVFKEKEEFKEIESVWEFCEEEEKFLINFQKELNSFIAGKKEEGVKKATK